MDDPVQMDIAMIRFDYEFGGAGPIFGAVRIPTAVTP
jgi:hypothetical protein